MEIYCLKGRPEKEPGPSTALAIYQLKQFRNKYAWYWVCDAGSNYAYGWWESLHFSRYKGDLTRLSKYYYKFEPELLEH